MSCCNTNIKTIHPDSDFCALVKLVDRKTGEPMTVLPEYNFRLEFYTVPGWSPVVVELDFGRLTGATFSDGVLTVKAECPKWKEGVLKWKMHINPRDAGFEDKTWDIVRQGYTGYHVLRKMGNERFQNSENTDAVMDIGADTTIILTLGIPNISYILASTQIEAISAGDEKAIKG